jgi:hypothetical protein
LNLGMAVCDKGRRMTTMARITALLLGLTAAAQAKPLEFDFETPDSLNPAALRAWWFPKNDSDRRSPSHTCRILRDSTAPLDGKWDAKVSFVLDGSPYPSAGIGFQFPQGNSADLRSMTSLSIMLHADRSRAIRVSIGNPLPAYAAANDTGVNLGFDAVVKDSTVTLTVPVSSFAYPRWAAETPALATSDVLALANAIQVTTSCASDTCSLDSGWIKIDDVILQGVNDTPPDPPAGNCSGTGTAVSNFSTAPVKQNVFGGWWYTYTDSSSTDTLAHGHSLYMDSSGAWSVGTWWPDTAAHSAPANFWLRRGGPYSGYGDLETQFTADLSKPRDLPGLQSIRFRTTIPSSFPDSQVSLAFHMKKAGTAYASGRDHQVQLPTPSGTTSWCINLDSLQQPDWVGIWKLPFTPDSLLTMSWEVTLAAMDTAAVAGFTIDSVVVYGWDPTGIARSATSAAGLTLALRGNALVLRRPSTEAATLLVLSPAGAVLSRQVWPAGEATLEIPAAHALRIALLQSSGSHQRLLLPASGF